MIMLHKFLSFFTQTCMVYIIFRVKSILEEFYFYYYYYIENFKIPLLIKYCDIQLTFNMLRYHKIHFTIHGNYSYITIVQLIYVHMSFLLVHVPSGNPGNITQEKPQLK